MIHLSGDNIKGSILKSVLKKRNTFWQMMGCMIRLKYKPSLLLVSAAVLCLVYFLSPLNIYTNSSFLLSHLDELLVLFIFLKILSHETLRFARYKAMCRKC